MFTVVFERPEKLIENIEGANLVEKRILNRIKEIIGIDIISG